MDTERESDEALRKVRFLMRTLTHLNAGGMLALCFWLSWAALDFNASHSTNPGAIAVHGCGCKLDEITNQRDYINVFADGR